MKKLPLQNPSFRYLEQSFKEWLDLQGYAESTVYNLPHHVRELLHYLEQKEISNIKDVDIKDIQGYYQKLRERCNQRYQSGGLSSGYLNKHIQAVRRFMEYLRKVGRLTLPDVDLNNEETISKITWLTEDEIQLLFRATHRIAERFDPNLKEAIQSRDRAMLSVFYGCGLRRTEGVNLNVSDINFDRSVLHVRKGKGNKERLVPISKQSRHLLTEYVYDHRGELTKGHNTDALFISYQHHKRMQGQSLNIRIKILQYHTEDIILQSKEVGLHTLRHSIATHLLHARMPLESISRFLGHDSLESTQVYTHLTTDLSSEMNMKGEASCEGGPTK